MSDRNVSLILFIISLFAIFAAFAFYAAFYYTTSFLIHDSVQKTMLWSGLFDRQIRITEQSANRKAQSANQVLDTSDWKTYRNEKYGFEFEYPPDYKITESAENARDSLLFPNPGIGVVLGSASSWVMSVLVGKSTTTLEVLTQYGILYGGPGGSTDKISVDGVDAIRFLACDVGGCAPEIMFSRSGYFYTLMYAIDNARSKNPDYAEIKSSPLPPWISTFKFIN